MGRKRRQSEQGARVTARMVAEFPASQPIVRAGELVTCADDGAAVYVDPVRFRWLIETGRATVEKETLE